MITNRLPHAIRKLEAAVSDAKEDSPRQLGRLRPRRRARREPLHLGQRAYPFLDMLRASEKEGADVTVGSLGTRAHGRCTASLLSLSLPLSPPSPLARRTPAALRGAIAPARPARPRCVRLFRAPLRPPLSPTVPLHRAHPHRPVVPAAYPRKNARTPCGTGATESGIYPERGCCRGKTSRGQAPLGGAPPKKTSVVAAACEQEADERLARAAIPTAFNGDSTTRWRPLSTAASIWSRAQHAVVGLGTHALGHAVRTFAQALPSPALSADPSWASTSMVCCS